MNFWLIAVIITLMTAIIILSFGGTNSYFRWSVYGCCVLGLIPENILLYRSCMRGADMLLPTLPLGFFLSFLSPIITDVFACSECWRFIALFAVVIAYGIILVKMRERYREKEIRKMLDLHACD